MRTRGIVPAAAALLTAALVTSASALQPVPPYGKCQNWQSRCAVAAGGTCDGVTGRWRVSERLMTGYLECVAIGQRKKK